MHHSKSKSTCECRGTTDTSSATLVSLLGPIAILADLPMVAPAEIAATPDHLITLFTGVVASPDGPPPRA